ncbi:MAG: hypothetical protein ABI295_05545 [Xanthomarina sp.]
MKPLTLLQVGVGFLFGEWIHFLSFNKNIPIIAKKPIPVQTGGCISFLIPK